MTLIDEIEQEVRETRRYLGKDRLDPRVLAAIASVPRDRFVPADERHLAYANHPLPIGHGQTISQPYIVAVMTDMLALKPGNRVLEVGTGSGYQAAVLAELVDEVYSIEIVAPLADQAGAVLRELGYDQVRTRIGDGYDGWPEQAPFDAIIVTAAVKQIPGPLLAQLKPGGRMAVPIEEAVMDQQLMAVDKDADGRLSSRRVLPVRFVPFTGGHSENSHT
jgi:protein-L-isoaspartate(D-aspartate) O-methyltransferase